MQYERWECVFGFKSQAETVIDGLVGLLIKGWASKYNVVDADGEFQVPGSLRDAVDTWGRQAKPMVLYQHGRDRILKMAPIGWGLKCEVSGEGLYVECFIPRDPTPPFRENAIQKRKRYREIYEGIKARAIRHFSIGGLFERFGKALHSWSMHECTVTPAGCLGEAAAFYLGGKSVNRLLRTEAVLGEKSLFTGVGDDELPFYAPPQEGPMTPALTTSSARPLVPQTTLGVLPRPAWGSVMRTAQQHGAKTLHDHLMSYPPHLQGQHDAESCPICQDERAGMGVKDAVWAPDSFGEKVKKDGPDSDYLVVDDNGEQHLRVKVNGTPNHRLMGQAYAALTSNFRGNPYEGDNKDGALAKLKRLYASEDLPWPGDRGEKAHLLETLRAQEHQHAAKIEEILDQCGVQPGEKAGRKINRSNAALLKAHADALGQLKAAIEKLLAENTAEEQDDAQEGAA